MLAIEVHHALEEVALLRCIERLQLTQGDRVEKPHAGVGGARSCRNLALARARIVVAGRLATRRLESRHECGQAVGELRDREWLVNDGVHAGELPLFGRCADNMRGQRDDRNSVTMLQLLRLPNGAGRRKAVHVRHAAVHQDDVMRTTRGGADGREAVFDRLDLRAQSGQRLDRDLAIDRAVVRDQDPEIRKSR